MIIKASNLASNRRDFLLNVLPAGTLVCLGCGNLSALTAGQDTQKAAKQKHKFLNDSGMTTKEVFDFSYLTYISAMQNLAQTIGKGKFIEMLKTAFADTTAQQMKIAFKDMPNRDLVSLSTFLLDLVKLNPFKNALTYEVVEKTDKAFELRYSECLFAKTFREANAAEVGYATCCYPDYAFVLAFNPKLKMIRTKTLMQGNDCCSPRVVWAV